MIKFITIILSILIIFPSILFAADNNLELKSKTKYEHNNAVSDPCESTSGLGQQECAQKKNEIADKKLNAIYKALLKKLSEVEVVEGGETGISPKKKLIQAQRAWIKFRNANCEFVGNLSGGVHTWKSVHEGFCFTEMTEERTKELQKYFKEL